MYKVTDNDDDKQRARTESFNQLRYMITTEFKVETITECGKSFKITMLNSQGQNNHITRDAMGLRALLNGNKLL